MSLDVVLGAIVEAFRCLWVPVGSLLGTFGDSLGPFGCSPVPFDTVGKPLVICLVPLGVFGSHLNCLWGAWGRCWLSYVYLCCSGALCYDFIHLHLRYDHYILDLDPISVICFDLMLKLFNGVAQLCGIISQTFLKYSLNIEYAFLKCFLKCSLEIPQIVLGYSLSIP